MEKKFTVGISNDKEVVKILTTESDVQAVQFAAYLHQASNIKHSIFVTDEKGVSVVSLTSLE